MTKPGKHRSPRAAYRGRRTACFVVCLLPTLAFALPVEVDQRSYGAYLDLRARAGFDPTSTGERVSYGTGESDTDFFRTLSFFRADAVQNIDTVGASTPTAEASGSVLHTATLSQDAGLGNLLRIEDLFQADGTVNYNSTSSGGYARARSEGTLYVSFSVYEPVRYALDLSMQDDSGSAGDLGYFQLTGPSLAYSAGTGSGPVEAHLTGVLDPGFYVLNTTAIISNEETRFLSRTNGPLSMSYLLQLSPAVLEQTWNNSAGGGYATAGNWDNNTPPTAFSMARFDLPDSYAVTFDTDAELAGLQVRDGQVGFALQDHRLAVNGIGSLLLESTSGAPAELRIDGGTLALDGNEIGRSGQGRLVFENGATLDGSPSLTLGTLAGASGALIATGSAGGGTPTSVGLLRLSVGNAGNGVVQVLDGAELVAGHMTVAFEPGGSGHFDVVGPGSELTVQPGIGGGTGGGTGDGTLLIGVRGNASFNVSNGARVDTFRTEMGVHATAVTSGLISGAGTLWRTDTAFVVGGDLATLTVEDGAKLQVQRFELGNTSTYALDPLSVVEFNGAGTQLNASGSILTGGHTRLLITDGAQMTSEVLWVQQGSTIELSGPGTRGSVDGTGDSLIVFGGSSLQIAGGAQLQSRSARHYIGINEVGTGYVTVSGPGSTWDMGLTDLFLGFNRVGADVGRGNLRLENGATVIAHDIFVGGLSSIEGGYSTLAANVHLLGGTLSPGLSPGPLFIDGDYSQDALSQLIIEIAGLAPGTEYDFLDITGNASLAGEIILRFLDGFAPQVGDSFDFLRVAGVLDIG
ncbi:MAG: hypothetical protein WBM84_09555, partial [Sedimenticolaceae bacterium]